MSSMLTVDVNRIFEVIINNYSFEIHFLANHPIAVKVRRHPLRLVVFTKHVFTYVFLIGSKRLIVSLMLTLILLYFVTRQLCRT